MKPSVLLPLVLVGAAALAFWALRSRPSTDAPASPSEPAHAAAEPQPASPATLQGERQPSATERPETTEVELVGEPARVAEPAPRTSVDAPQPGTRAPLTVAVVDADGAPVQGARVALESIRSASSPSIELVGSGGRGEARTGKDGEASIRYPVTTRTGEATDWIAFTVEHPEFLRARVTEFSATRAQATVSLERTALVIVSGWIGTPETTITDVEPTLSFAARTTRQDWRPLEDGRLGAFGIPPGRHSILITHRASDGAHYASALSTFDLFENERKELALELVPAPTLEGRLSNDVPRPVVGGRVLVGFQAPPSEPGQPWLLLRRDAQVAGDGSFAIAGVPPLQGEIVAAAEGWTSTLLPTRDLKRLGVTRADDDVIAEAQRRLGARALALQELDGRTDEGPKIVEMEPTGTLVVTLRDPDEAPLAGALVSLPARVRWKVGMSEPWIGTTSVTTDDNGQARFTMLPAGAHNLEVVHDAFVLPLQERPNGRSERIGLVQVESGITNEVAFDLERP